MRRFSILFSLLLVFFSCKSQRDKKEITSRNTDSTFHFDSLSASTKEKYLQEIQPLYQKLLLQKGFNGAILVAKNGEIIMEDYRGFYNLNSHEDISTTTPLHLASISKTFTAMVVLHLWEEGKISLDDKIQQYLPDFPYQNITIKNLLSHRSGLPNYVQFMDERKTVVSYRKNKKGKLIKIVKQVPLPKSETTGFKTNQDMLQYMINKKPAIQALPDKVFHYCNTNYALLALIVEKITNTSFPQYMKDSVFDKLGMKNTFVFNKETINQYIPSYYRNKRVFPLEKLDCIYGDKNVYSTPRDMLLWDKALYEGSFVSKPTLEMAFTPYSKETKSKHNYGLGWRMLLDQPEGTIIYHNGWWHGNRTVFTRILRDTATLIILTNNDNKNVYKAREMMSVFTGSSDTTSLEE